MRAIQVLLIPEMSECVTGNSEEMKALMCSSICGGLKALRYEQVGSTQHIAHSSRSLVRTFIQHISCSQFAIVVENAVELKC